MCGIAGISKRDDWLQIASLTLRNGREVDKNKKKGMVYSLSGRHYTDDFCNLDESTMVVAGKIFSCR